MKINWEIYKRGKIKLVFNNKFSVCLNNVFANIKKEKWQFIILNIGYIDYGKTFGITILGISLTFSFK